MRKLVLSLAVTGAAAGGVLAYSNYDPVFKNQMNEKVPGFRAWSDKAADIWVDMTDYFNPKPKRDTKKDAFVIEHNQAKIKARLEELKKNEPVTPSSTKSEEKLTVEKEKGGGESANLKEPSSVRDVKEDPKTKPAKGKDKSTSEGKPRAKSERSKLDESKVDKDKKSSEPKQEKAKKEKKAEIVKEQVQKESGDEKEVKSPKKAKKEKSSEVAKTVESSKSPQEAAPSQHTSKKSTVPSSGSKEPVSPPPTPGKKEPVPSPGDEEATPTSGPGTSDAVHQSRGRGEESSLPTITPQMSGAKVMEKEPTKEKSDKPEVSLFDFSCECDDVVLV